MHFTPEILRTSVRMVGVCAVVWPTLYVLNKNGGNFAINPNEGNLDVYQDVIQQAVKDAMNPRFDDIAKRFDEGLAKIDLGVDGLKKDFKKSRKNLDNVRDLDAWTRIAFDLLTKKQ